MYAHVTDGQINADHRELPSEHWIADTPTTGHFVPLTPANAAEHGYLPVVRHARPADTASTTWEPTVTITDQVVHGWTERPKTTSELAGDAARLEQEVVRKALDTLDTFISSTNPTAADIVRQLKLLSRISKRLIQDNYGGVGDA